MEAFLQGWFYDWLSLTAPNSANGKGSRVHGPAGDREALDAGEHLSLWATLQGLRVMRVGRGSDGYQGAAHMAYDPTSSARIATIRGGHATNMPSIELPGAEGVCAHLAPRALAELGPMLVSRADVSLDVSQPGLWEDIDVLCTEMAASSRMDPPRYDGTEGKGRTLYFGKGEASMRVYEKDLERVARGGLSEEDADPNLVRIEFTFRPTKGRKSAFGAIAREDGPGALLGTTHWVRRLVERLAVMTEAAREEQAELAVTRVVTPPDPRPIRVRAAHGASQYASTFARAAIAQIVQDKYRGDWLNATMTADDVVTTATRAVEAKIREVVELASEDLGVTRIRDHEEEAQRAQQLLEYWIAGQREAARRAQHDLYWAAERARQMCEGAAA